MSSSTAVPRPPDRDLTSFSVLTLDIYGTLIDWETGIINGLEPLISRLPASHALKSTNDDPEQNKIAIGRAFTSVEAALQREHPGLKYSALLTEAYLRFARENNLVSSSSSSSSSSTDEEEVLKKEAHAFGHSIGSWPAFPDSVDAMNRLHRHFKLVPVTNVDVESFAGTCSGPLGGIQPGFDAAYTAEQIGSYKPSLKNFYYLLDHLEQDFGIEKHQVLHTAQSLTHDHEPAEKMGLRSAWIARGPGGNTGMGGDVDAMIKGGKVGFSWRFSSLAEMAGAVEKEVAAAKGS